MMKITLSMVIDKLGEDRFETVQISSTETAGISGVRCVNKKAAVLWRPEILYLFAASDGTNWNSAELPQNCICVSNQEKSLLVDDQKAMNFAVLKSDVGLELLLEKIIDILVDFHECFNRMVKMIADNKGLAFLVDQISIMLGNPIYVADSDFKILAMAHCELKNKAAWHGIVKDGIENGYISSSVNDYFFMKDFIRKIGESPKPVFFSGNEFYPNAFCSMNLRSKNKNLGLVTVFETEKKFTGGTRDLLEFLSDLLVLEIQKNPQIIVNEGVKLGNLFADMLCENFNSQNELNKVINYLEFSFPENYFIFVAMFNKPVNNTYQLTFLKKKLTAYIQSSISIIHEDKVVILANDKSENLLKSETIKAIKEWLEKSDAIAGFSKNFGEISQIKKAYDEAIIAIKIGRKTKKEGLLFNYNDFRFEHLIDLIAKVSNISELGHPSLQNLLSHDQLKGSDLTKTLYAYMKNGRSQAKTATELHMHRSSLQYRLNKMEEIMGIDLNDYRTFLHLQITFEILNRESDTDAFFA